MKQQPRLSIEYRDPNTLKPHPKNARAHSPAQIDEIGRSIEAVGWTRPVIIDEKGEILAGHGATLAALQRGITEVPVIVRKGLTEALKRSYRLADNKLAEKSTWDTPLLREELGLLKGMGFDLALTGFDQDEISFMLAPPPIDLQEPPAAGPQAKAVSVVGDLWLMDDHRIICGDNSKTAVWDRLMNGRQAQCMFTDPPYGVSYLAPSGRFEMIKGDALRRGQLKKMLHDSFQQAVKHTRDDAGWYVWHASATHLDFAEAMRDAGLAELEQIIWVKPGIILGWADYRWAHEPCIYAAKQGIKPAFHGERSSSTIWRANPVNTKGEQDIAISSGITLVAEGAGEITVTGAPPNKGKKLRHIHLKAGQPAFLTALTDTDSAWEVSRDNGHGKDAQLHPNQKPVALARKAIANSTLEGQIVVDFYDGSGSLIIAAEQLKRIAYAIDLDPLYVDVAVRRWQDLTGKKATHATEKKSFDAIAADRASKAVKARAKAKA